MKQKATDNRNTYDGNKTSKYMCYNCKRSFNFPPAVAVSYFCSGCDYGEDRFYCLDCEQVLSPKYTHLEREKP